MRLGVGRVPSAPGVAGPQSSLIQLPEGHDRDTFTLLPPRLPVQAQAPSLCQQSPVTLLVPVTKPTISLFLLRGHLPRGLGFQLRPPWPLLPALGAITQHLWPTELSSSLQQL